MHSSKVQLALKDGNSLKLDENGIKLIKSAVGVVLHTSRMIGMT